MPTLCSSVFRILARKILSDLQPRAGDLFVVFHSSRMLSGTNSTQTPQRIGQAKFSFGWNESVTLMYHEQSNATFPSHTESLQYNNRW